MASPFRASIGFRLPLVLAVLLSVAFGAMTAALYREIRATTMAAASARLGQAARQLADTMARGVRTRGAALAEVADRPAVLAVLHENGPTMEEAISEVSSALGQLVGDAPGARVEVWDRDGRPLLAAGAVLPFVPADDPRTALAGLTTARGRVWVSPFQAFDGVLRYSIGVPVHAGDKLAGFIVDRRQLATPAQSIELLAGLIGDEAELLVGNTAGTVWSDLRQLVPPPPDSALGDGELVEYRRSTASAVFARITPIADTPWLVAIEVPKDVVLAPVGHMLNRALVLAVIVVGLATAVGWWLSLRITRPLERVTAMAEAIAEERPAERLGWPRRDEVGRLAASFNIMADRVEDSRRRYEGLVHELEARVGARTAELSAANRELEAFTYSVSHDLRAPLRAIEGFARIVEEDHGVSLPAEGVRCLQTIRRNVTRMGALIDDLLRLSRVGRQPLSRTPLDMTAVARAAAAEVSQAGSPAPPAVVVHPLPAASGERTLVRQVFSNLVANAVKFSRPRGGEALVEVGAKADGVETAYFVRDNGVGFDAKYAGKLFGVFQRLHRAEDFEGTGVGLAIVQRIVHRHGGRVWAEGEPGRGATFYFTLPDEG